jgi:membrane protease YdiL (CAAX protease family)
MSDKMIAPWWHTVIVLMVFAAAIVSSVDSIGTSTGGPADHGGIPLYVSIICFEWVMFGITWVGTRRRVTLRELMGARWSGRRAFVRNVLITIAFWVVWEGTDKAMDWLLHSGEPANVGAMLPQGMAEFIFWILLSTSAGICEEFVFRGYLQRQFAALTRSATAGLLLQAVVFGVMHGYQGWKKVIIITVLGVLYGLMVQWRRTILPGMASHIWADIISGWPNP